MIDDLDVRFAAPTGTPTQEIHHRCRQLADYLNDNLRGGREMDEAIVHLEQAMFWADAALLRNYGPGVD
jgi:hypothetical protein